jgi:tetratricopeptide (TPR) repeat protein
MDRSNSCALSLRKALLAAIGFALFAALRAQAQAPGSSTAIEPLKSRTLDLLAAAGMPASGNGCPAPAGVGFYFGGTGLDGRPLGLSLGIDGAAPVEYRLSGEESAALAEGGMFHPQCLELAPGKHHLHAVLSHPGTAAGEASQGYTLEQEVEVPAAEGLLELQLRRSLLQPGLELSAPAGNPWRGDAGGWRAWLGLDAASGDRFVLGEADDPRVRHARFLVRTGHALSAVTVLRRVRADADARSAALSPHFALELADAELAYGLSAQAESDWRNASAGRGDRAFRFALGLRLAQYRYRHGELAAAAALLEPLQPADKSRSGAERSAWQDLYARVLLAQQRYEEAAEVLKDTPNEADFDSWLRYSNYGVALVQAGQVQQGLTVLDRVGSIIAADLPQLRLRSRANLMLARYFLAAQQGATAIPLFGRIESEGPYSGSALLGLGWAWLVPAGEQQPEIRLGDEIVTGAPPESRSGRIADVHDQNLYQRFNLAPFIRVSQPGDEAGRLRRALAAWMVVADRGPQDQDAAEADLAIAWALRRLGDAQQAVQYDERAVSSLELHQALLGRAEAQARDEHAPDRWLAADTTAEPGQQWTLPALPPPPGADYLRTLLASDAFQAALHDYRDLALMQRGLETQDSPDAPALRADIAQAQQAQRLLLRDRQLDALAQQRRHFEQLLIYARNALTAAYDAAGPATLR